MPSSESSFTSEDFYNNQMNMAHLSCIRNVQVTTHDPLVTLDDVIVHFHEIYKFKIHFHVLE